MSLVILPFVFGAVETAIFQQFFNGWWAFRFFIQLHKTSSDFTARHSTSEITPTKGNPCVRTCFFLSFFLSGLQWHLPDPSELLPEQRLLGSPYVQDWSARNCVQDECGQFQPCTSAQTNPTPSSNSYPLGGSRSAGAGALTQLLERVLETFFQNKFLAAQRPASPNMTSILHKVLCRPVLHIRRVRLLLLLAGEHFSLFI